MPPPVPDYRSFTLAKGLGLLRIIIADNARSSLSEIARVAAVPLSTAHRLAVTLESEGFLTRVGKGCYQPGPALGELIGSRARVDPLAARLRRPLARLARDANAFAHYGILEEGMVTYLVREPGGGRGLFTAETMQQEAYCSALGKVLLAALPGDEMEAYLAGGPFIGLTTSTITDPEHLRDEIAKVRVDGVGFDRHEIREDLYCIAVPVRAPGGRVNGAISLSFVGHVPEQVQQVEFARRARSIGARAVAASKPM